MSIRIEDGAGSGSLVGVTSSNKLRTQSTTASEAAYSSEKGGVCYSWSTSYDYSAGDTILLIKNTSVNYNLLIESIYVSSDVSTEIIIHSPDCDTPTGTTVEGVNLNRTSGKTAGAIAKQNETTNTQGSVLYRIVSAPNTLTLPLPISGVFILGTNNCIAVDFVSNGALGVVSIVGYYHLVE